MGAADMDIANKASAFVTLATGAATVAVQREDSVVAKAYSIYRTHYTISQDQGLVGQRQSCGYWALIYHKAIPLPLRLPACHTSRTYQ